MEPWPVRAREYTRGLPDSQSVEGVVSVQAKARKGQKNTARREPWHTAFAPLIRLAVELTRDSPRWFMGCEFVSGSE